MALKTKVVTAIVVLSNLLGNLSLTVGLRRAGALVVQSPLTYIEVLFHPWVAVGISLLILWMLSHMALLSWADLSYVLPVTAIGYVLVAVVGKVFLHEVITISRWSGIGLIIAGVMLVAKTAPNSHPETSGRPAEH